jgi:putative oxidoreductase
MKILLSTGNHSTPINFGLLIFRIGVSIMMLTHGYPKLLKIIDANFQPGDPLGVGAEASMIMAGFSEFALVLAGFAEFICSIFLIFGLATRCALVPLIITMSVALTFVHIDDPFKSQEKAFFYLLAYLFMLITGPGKYSIDQKLFN